MTAIALFCRAELGDARRPTGALGAKIVAADLPRWDESSDKPAIDFYYWHAGTVGLLAEDGASGPAFKAWSKAVLEALRGNQRAKGEGCLEGSWDTEAVDRWGWAGGRVYAASLNALTLLATTSSGGAIAARPDDAESADGKKGDAKTDAKARPTVVPVREMQRKRRRPVHPLRERPLEGAHARHRATVRELRLAGPRLLGENARRQSRSRRQEGVLLMRCQRMG
jgi:hypothetical protein